MIIIEARRIKDCPITGPGVALSRELNIRIQPVILLYIMLLQNNKLNN